MDPIDLNEWRLDSEAPPVLHMNPRLDEARQPGEDLRAWLENEPRAKGHHLFQTSGTTSKIAEDHSPGRWVALSTPALMASATAVNHHLRVGPEDRWLLALPTFHIGGFSILARAALAEIPLTTMDERWQPNRFVEHLESSGATLTSLVPTQISDLVSEGLRPPESLRSVMVGGGRLDPRLHQQAIDLHWPLLRTYGMTETASQVATESPDTRPSSLGNPWLPILPCWEVRLVEPETGPIESPPDEAIGQLELRGPALFSAHVETDAGQQWTWVDSTVDGWWRCPDLIQTRAQPHPEAGPELRWHGRADRIVKVLGELVGLDQVESRVRTLAEPAWRDRLAVITMGDPRKGRSPVLVTDKTLAVSDLRTLAEKANQILAPFERIHALWRVDNLPRTSLGKVRHTRLEVELADAIGPHSSGDPAAPVPAPLEAVAQQVEAAPGVSADFA